MAAKQYQSISGVVNEPTDANRQYQTTQAVVQVFDVGAAFDAALFPHLRVPDSVRARVTMTPSGRIA